MKKSPHEWPPKKPSDRCRRIAITNLIEKNISLLRTLLTEEELTFALSVDPLDVLTHLPSTTILEDPSKEIEWHIAFVKGPPERRTRAVHSSLRQAVRINPPDSSEMMENIHIRDQSVLAQYAIYLALQMVEERRKQPSINKLNIETTLANIEKRLRAWYELMLTTCREENSHDF